METQIILFLSALVLLVTGFFLVDEFWQKSPDLIVEDVLLENGELFIVQKNQGRSNIPKGTRGRTDVYLDGSEVPLFSTLWKELVDENFLDSGGVSEVKPNYFLTGDHNIRVCIDASFIVEESHEENNCLEKRLGEIRVRFTLQEAKENALGVNRANQELLRFSIHALEPVTITELPIGISASNDQNNPDAGLLNASNGANFKQIRLVNLKDRTVLSEIVDASLLKTDLNGGHRIDEETDGGSMVYYTFLKAIELKAGETLQVGLWIDLDANESLSETVVTANLLLNEFYPKVSGESPLENRLHVYPNKVISGPLKIIMKKQVDLSVVQP